MRKPLRVIAMTVSALLSAVLAPALMPTAASAVAWVPNPTWSQLNADQGAGIRQQDLRLFDGNSIKETDNSGQHGTVYVRTDVKTVTVRYDCTLQQAVGKLPASTCAGSQVQFWLDLSGMDFSRVKVTVDGVQRRSMNVYLNKTADDTGQAAVTISLANVGTAAKGLVLMSDDYIGVSVSNCDRTIARNTCGTTDRSGTTATAGPLSLLFQDKGYFPQVKILNQDKSDALPNCGGLQWARDETWDWSVFKRPWLGDYACVYTKSYPVGATATIPYQVKDIWGTPMANYPVDFSHPSSPPNCGSVRCKWANDVMHKYTDKNGYVTFTARNLNTPADACSNVGYNQDTKQTHTCAIGVGMTASTGMDPESDDLFWPQFVNTTNMKPDYVDFHVRSRGYLNTLTDSNGVPMYDYVRDGNGVKNPALPIAGSAAAGVGAEFQASTIVSTLDVKYFANSNPDAVCFRGLDPKHPQKVKWVKPGCKEQVPLYAPDVTVSADNGGVIAQVCPDGNNADVCAAARLPRSWDLTSTSQMKSSVTFGFQYLSQFVFTATKTGKTTFTVKIGGQTYTVAQTYIDTPPAPSLRRSAGLTSGDAR